MQECHNSTAATNLVLDAIEIVAAHACSLLSRGVHTVCWCVAAELSLLPSQQREKRRTWRMRIRARVLIDRQVIVLVQGKWQQCRIQARLGKLRTGGVKEER